MHACCEVGERLLKTEAKKISRTAQQREAQRLRGKRAAEYWIATCLTKCVWHCLEEVFPTKPMRNHQHQKQGKIHFPVNDPISSCSVTA
jgi:hypothetical protein